MTGGSSLSVGGGAIERSKEAEDSSSQESTCVQLMVSGVDPPTEDLSRGLLNHLREKLEELTLLRFATLLPRIADTRLSPADLAFLRQPDVPPLAVTTLRLPAVHKGAITPTIGYGEASEVMKQWATWLLSCSGWLRAGGWCPLTHAPTSEKEVLSLLHVPPPRGAAATSSGRVSLPGGPHKLLTVFVSIERVGYSFDAAGPDDQRVRALGGSHGGQWMLVLRA